MADNNTWNQQPAPQQPWQGGWSAGQAQPPVQAWNQQPAPQQPWQGAPAQAGAEGALDWESDIEKDSQFTEIPPGDYDFAVDHMEKSWFNGSEKIEACNMAIVYLNILLPSGETAQIRENFILHTKMEWKISSFFSSIGMKKKGERVKMQWGAIAGRKGRCSVSLDEDRKTGNKYNHVRSFYPAGETPAGWNWQR